MDDSSIAKCSCQHCGVHLEFPAELAGTDIDCPSCGQKTFLSGLGIDTGPGSELTVSHLLEACPGSIPKSGGSFFYGIGLLLVTGMMVVLPVLYLALIGLAAWGTFLWAEHFKGLVTSTAGGIRLYPIKLLAYISPIFAGGVLVFFMVKPLFAGRVPRSQPLALHPGAEPLLFTFIDQVCRAVGAPSPQRVDVDCHLNASASFRRGIGSFFGNDLVLTIGLPLVAGMTLKQFAGILAHEFGHFRQGFGMRLTYIIRSVNAWFGRVVYERDAWDVRLDEWGESGDWKASLMAMCAQFAVWLSRLALMLLMFLGHGISCFMLRQMEFDADRCPIKLVGSETYESMLRRLAVLGNALNVAYQNVRAMWMRQSALPDDFPAYFMSHDDHMPAEVRTQIEDTFGLARSGLFHTHPSEGDRIRRARQAGEAGFFQLDGRATALFSNFGVLSRQVSVLHYQDDLGIPVQLGSLCKAEYPAAE